MQDHIGKTENEFYCDVGLQNELGIKQNEQPFVDQHQFHNIALTKLKSDTTEKINQKQANILYSNQIQRSVDENKQNIDRFAYQLTNLQINLQKSQHKTNQEQNQIQKNNHQENNIGIKQQINSQTNCSNHLSSQSVLSTLLLNTIVEQQKQSTHQQLNNQQKSHKQINALTWENLQDNYQKVVQIQKKSRIEKQSFSQYVKSNLFDDQSKILANERISYESDTKSQDVSHQINQKKPQEQFSIQNEKILNDPKVENQFKQSNEQIVRKENSDRNSSNQQQQNINLSQHRLKLQQSSKLHRKQSLNQIKTQINQIRCTTKKQQRDKYNSEACKCEIM